MRRRELLAQGAALGLLAAAPRAARAVEKAAETAQSSGGLAKLTLPANRMILVAFALSEGATVIDFAGPWEVFSEVMLPELGSSMDDQMPFRLSTVAESKTPVTASGGLKIVPGDTFESSPQPNVIVVPAQHGGKALHEWLRKASVKADVTMSVCTGAFQLARAGLLSGKAATTHHEFLDDFAKEFPDIKVRRGLRFVESGPHLATAGGLTSGIDLALRVVERYFGHAAAERTASYMEYQGKGWIV